ncbi:MAG: hypothetical protein AB8E87_08600 [Prochlorococcus sp.]
MSDHRNLGSVFTALNLFADGQRLKSVRRCIMDQEFFEAPDTISHQQLAAMLASAPRDGVDVDWGADSNVEVPFDDLATDWLRDGEWIMEEIEASADGISDSRSPCQKVALSAFVVHLSLAMAALEKALGKVSEEGDCS